MTAIRKREWLSPKGQKKTAWLVDYKDQHGKRRARQFPTKKEAEAYSDRARDEIRQGRHTHDRDSITVAVAADLWIAASDAEGLERSTIKRYRELAKLHIAPKFGELKLSQLSKAQVVEWRQELLIEKSRSMASKIIRALSAILNNAMEIGAISQNVASDVKVGRAKREAARVEPPARTDLKKMIEAATDNERPFLLTAITMGLRSSELRGLCWRDVDLKVGTLTVRQRADEWGVLGPPKSEAGRRTIPMPPQLVAELTRWKLRCRPSHKGLVFPSVVGTPLRHNNVLRRLYFPLQVRAGLGVPKLNKSGQPIIDNEGNPVLTGKYRFHALRHAAASGWIASKIDLKRLQVWIGHESIQLTLDTYGHLLADQERDAELAMLASRDLFA
ncbi:tyrosine-type recombinase/integrase [uncultured Erythrobacter sp.]|uniref:tyrosine-type recombinase/integrase n=1 Tax=uncultured Erythrobacter sp. TaxID=263913 RepID=UPI0026342972|nr:tyrosine-type recombinase/integrase [uncultured Erythrobacter sp.]